MGESNMKTTVTDLETFRLFRDEEWMTFDMVIAQSLRLEPQTVEMAVSSAWHDVLQNWEQYATLPDPIAEHAEDGSPADETRALSHVRHASGWTFDLSGMEAEIAILPLRELRAHKVYDVEGITLYVGGKVDGTDGIQVDDHKMKFSGSFDAERYGDSYQWRIYLDILGAERFNFNVFMAKPLRSNEVFVKELHVLPLYRYPELERDVRVLLSDYVAFAREHLNEEAITRWKEDATRRNVSFAIGNEEFSHLDPNK